MRAGGSVTDGAQCGGWRQLPGPAAVAAGLFADEDGFSAAGAGEGALGVAVGGFPLQSFAGAGACGEGGADAGRFDRGVEELAGGPEAVPVPDDAGHIRAGLGDEAEGERWRLGGEASLGDGQDTAFGVVGIAGEEEAAAGGTDDANAAAAAMSATSRSVARMQRMWPASLTLWRGPRNAAKGAMVLREASAWSTWAPRWAASPGRATGQQDQYPSFVCRPEG